MRRESYLVLLLVFAALFAYYSVQFPAFGSSEYLGRDRTVAGHYLENTLTDTGSWNVVSAVVWMYRGYDTMGEVTVLFTAALSVSFLWRMMQK
ncbi:MAG: hydrogen gas-evolving membrane-bound hydrogenase subunit E [archaeon]